MTGFPALSTVHQWKDGMKFCYEYVVVIQDNRNFGWT